MMQHSSPMQRRTLLRLRVAAGAVLAAAGGGLALLRPGLVDGRLGPTGREGFAAVARAVLEGSLPAEPPARDTALGANPQLSVYGLVNKLATGLAQRLAGQEVALA
jgi:hypothetical protein